MADAVDMHEHREHLRTNSRAEVEAIARLAGLEVRRVWELANGYWPLAPEYDRVRRPWWLLQTDIGLIQIGWRKRVLNIDWSASAVRGVVTGDDVTKGDDHVHAWSVEKAIEYLRELRRLVARACASCRGTKRVTRRLPFQTAAREMPCPDCAGGFAVTAPAPCYLTPTQADALALIRKSYPSKMHPRSARIGHKTVEALEAQGLIEPLAGGYARALPWCRACGCTSRHACEGGCAWLVMPMLHEPGLCSGCET